MRTLVLLAVVMWPAVIWACDSSTPAISVVGRKNDTHVLLRYEDEYEEGKFIGLYALELATGKEELFANILSSDDAPEDRAKLRGARWKAAEAKLAAEGFVLEKHERQAFPAKAGDVTFSVSEDRDSES